MSKSYLMLITGDRLDEVYNYIKEISNGWWKHMPSSMVFKSELSSVQIREKIIEKHGKSIKSIVIFSLSGEAAWKGINEGGTTWLKGNL